jgi:hypothetical protein
MTPRVQKVSDPGKRCSAIVMQAIADGYAGYWIAIRLSDGGTDGVLYWARDSAVKHQLTESQCAYIQIPPDSMPPEEADTFLQFHRKCYDAGFRLTDPDGPEPVAPLQHDGYQIPWRR